MGDVFFSLRINLSGCTFFPWYVSGVGLGVAGTCPCVMAVLKRNPVAMRRKFFIQDVFGFLFPSCQVFKGGV